MEVAFIIIALFAEIIGTIAGFGSSTIALPLALLLFDFPTALVLVAVLHISGGLARAGFFRSAINWRFLVWFGLPSVLATVAGALLVARIQPEVLKGVLGVFLIVYAVFSWRSVRRISAVPAALAGGGIISGFFAGLVGTGGALRAMFLDAFGLPKERYIATAAIIALLVDLTRLPIYLTAGFLPSSLYSLVPFVVIAAVAGAFIGRLIVTKIPQQRFRRIVLAAVALAGGYFLFPFVI